MSELKVSFKELPEIMKRNLRLVNYIQTISDIYSRVPHLGAAVDTCRASKDDYAVLMAVLDRAINFEHVYTLDKVQILSWVERFKITEKEVQHTLNRAIAIAATFGVEYA